MAPRILLVQARNVDDPMLRHELSCFAAQCGLELPTFETLNLCCDPVEHGRLGEVDAVMVGGSGEYSLAQGGFGWHDPFLDFLREVVRRDIPTFASCFGFQALVQALGGDVVSHPDQAEVGTFCVRLTDEGKRDPLFGALPAAFDAQLGHNDSVRNLPPDVIRLAVSDRCETQAVRVRGTRIVATQFHPELTMEDNLVRHKRYLALYSTTTCEEALAEAAALHRASEEANSLLRGFIAQLTGDLSGRC